MSGDVYVWWPWIAPLKDAIHAQNGIMNDAGLKAHATAEGVIPCSTWELQHEPTMLPPLPQLPQLSSLSAEPVKLVKIAALESQLIGLTNHGHVLKISVDSALRLGRWEYVCQCHLYKKISCLMHV